MFVDPTFVTHWKTLLLEKALGPRAPAYVLRLWAFCEQRKSERLDVSAHALAAICHFEGPADELVEAQKEAGYLDVDGDTLVAHEWEAHNAALVQRWNAGKKGGCPVNRGQHPRNKNRSITGAKPEDNRPSPPLDGPPSLPPQTPSSLPPLISPHTHTPSFPQGGERESFALQGELISQPDPKPEKPKEQPKQPGEYPPGFEAVRQEYPVARRQGMKDALKFWKRDGCEQRAEKILTALKLYKRWHPDWRKEEGRFVPQIATWINQRAYEDLGFVPREGRVTDAGQEDRDWWKPILRQLYPDDPRLNKWLALAMFHQLPVSLKEDIKHARRQTA